MAIERSRHRPLTCPSGPTRWCNNSRRDTRRPRPRSSGDRAMVSGTMCRRFESFRGRCRSGALTRETPWHFFARPETADVRHRPPGQGVIGRVEEECSRAVANRASVPSSCPLSPGAAAAFEVWIALTFPDRWPRSLEIQRKWSCNVKSIRRNSRIKLCAG